MKEKYLKYTLEELIEDQDFVSWVKHNNNSFIWNSFLSEHPEIRMKVREAKKIILSFKEEEEELKLDEVLSMWRKIEHFNNLTMRSSKTNALIKNILRYAAIISIVALIGTVTTYYLIGSKSKNAFFSQRINPAAREIELILAQGDVIPLKDNSRVEVKGNNEILINSLNSIDIQDQEQNPDDKVKMNELIVPFGQKTFVILEDSTKVWLCAGSRLAFPTIFKGDKREVYLQGEAYFEVSHNPNKPFIVNMRELTAKVIGTRFYLSSYSNDENIITVLFDGKVILKEYNLLGIGNKQIVMEPGQKAVLNKNKMNFEVKKIDDAYIYIAWTKGWFSFSKESTFNVFKKLERYYNVKIIYPESFQSDAQISGKLDLKDSIDSVMSTLAELTKISYNIKNDTIYIK